MIPVRTRHHRSEWGKAEAMTTVPLARPWLRSELHSIHGPKAHP